MLNITIVQWRESLKQETHCVYCNREFSNTDGVYLVIDHVIPRAQGGPDIPSNLVAACAECNGSKADKRLEDWAYVELDNGNLPLGVGKRVSSCIIRNLDKFSNEERGRQLQLEYDQRHPPGIVCAHGEDGSNRIPEEVKQQILKKAIHSSDYESIAAGYHNWMGKPLSVGTIRKILKENFKIVQEHMNREMTESAERVRNYWEEHPEEAEKFRILANKLASRYGYA